MVLAFFLTDCIRSFELLLCFAKGVPWILPFGCRRCSSWAYWAWGSCSRSWLRVSACKGDIMILLTAAVTVLLFVYLLAALLRPEWF
jgi:K+-transporting ATPase KdpF subunit